MRRKITTALLLALALATPGIADAAIDPETKVALDTLWVLLTAFLVFWMNAGFALVESGLCQAKNAVNILAKNFIVFAASSIAFWVIGFGLMFGDGNPFIGLTGWLLQRRRQQPRHGGCLPGRVHVAQLDRRAAVREVLLSAGLRRNGGDHRERRRGRAHQVRKLRAVLVHPGWPHLSGRRPLGVGRRLAGGAGIPRLRRLHRRPQHRRVGRAGGRHRARAAPWQVPAERQGQADSRTQHDVGDARLPDSLARVVRVQSGQHDGGRPGGDCLHRAQHQHGGGGGMPLGDPGGMAPPRQARPQHDHQRDAGRAGCDHRRLQRGHGWQLGHHRVDCGCHRGLRGAVLRQGEARRPGWRLERPPGERRVRDALLWGSSRPMAACSWAAASPRR